MNGKFSFNPTTIYTGPQKDYHFPKPLQSTKIGRGAASYQILDLFCGFDIETTTVHTPEGRHLAFAYHFQFSIGTPRGLNVYLFRKWEHLIDFLNAMADHYQLNEKKHILVGDANLGFEFAFARKRLQWDEGEWDFFAKEKNQPLKATYRGIEFREILSITGGSLAQLAEDYCTTQKLVTIDENGVKHSELDYSIARNSSTPMTDTEIAYCINDVVIVSEFMWYLFANFIWPERYIPMTFTGILDRQIKAELKTICRLRDDRQHIEHGSSLQMWKDYILKMQPSEEEYTDYFKYLFRGGYVHGNALYCGQTVRAHMRDVTSHYPTRLLLSAYPVTPFKDVDLSQFKTYRSLINYVNKVCHSECVIMKCIFDFVRTTTTHTIESKNKIVWYTNGDFDNGRLLSCDEMCVYLDNYTWLIYQMYYKYAGVTILSLKTAKRGKLPPYITNVVKRHYVTKESLKRRGLDKTMAYTISKSRLNSTYGYLVKRLHTVKTMYSNDLEWYEDNTGVDYYKEIKKSIVSPYYGIFCTAAARYELLSLMYKLTKAGVKCYYADTDSLKYEPCHKAEKIFKHYNISIYRHRKNRKLRSELYDGLGEFDKEGFRKYKDGSKEWVIVDFKMLGAKRYIYSIDDKTYATVAGMPKASVDQIGKTKEEIFDGFNLFGYHLQPEDSNKLTTSYTDNDYSYMIDGELMEERSGVALYEIPFTLTIKEEYREHIRRLREEKKRYSEVI